MYILSFSPCSHPPGSPQHLGAHNGETSPRVSGFLVFALVLGSFTALLTTGLYLKTLQEKRAEQVSLIIMTPLTSLVTVQARVKSLLRVVAEQSELRPSLTSLTLTSFTSLRDPECAHARETRGEKGAHTAHREEELSQEPPSYDDLLK